MDYIVRYNYAHMYTFSVAISTKFQTYRSLNEIKQHDGIHASDEYDKKQEFHFNRLVHKLD